MNRLTAYVEAYRSGHNGPDSKSGDGQPSVGSNPTASARPSGIHSQADFVLLIAWVELQWKGTTLYMERRHIAHNALQRTRNGHLRRGQIREGFRIARLFIPMALQHLCA